MRGTCDRCRIYTTLHRGYGLEEKAYWCSDCHRRIGKTRKKILDINVNHFPGREKNEKKRDVATRFNSIPNRMLNNTNK